ncbi:hypothetical protein HSBGL_2211 [Halapricum desulfuricans]|uniref:Uncharacterized protein n=1 Tax=Halapricum desulfuricans TaxID=2841257 RepID=A0A897NJ31_9EURY|nr:hypothetical protein [Halapricum desulfuricans]QSG12618.1 hypothetical protein HSBGL_2211 [Halapricum desulfuricans]
MSNQQVEDALIKVDRWSKIIALFFAMGMFGLATLLADNATLNAAIAAFAAIGVRISIPYFASISGYGLDQAPSQSYADTGNYHHGAVGGGLIVGSFLALAIMTVETPAVAFAGGAAGGVVSMLLLREGLPSE